MLDERCPDLLPPVESSSHGWVSSKMWIFRQSGDCYGMWLIWRVKGDKYGTVFLGYKGIFVI